VLLVVDDETINVVAPNLRAALAKSRSDPDARNKTCVAGLKSARILRLCKDGLRDDNALLSLVTNEHIAAMIVSCYMKKTQVIIPWKEGLHLRPASRLVRLAKASKSAIWLKVGDQVADARSILAILLLCAATGTVIDLEINGEDEDAVLTSITSVFYQEVLAQDLDQGDLTIGSS
jgi:phosphocarrier protein HPr